MGRLLLRGLGRGGTKVSRCSIGEVQKLVEDQGVEVKIKELSVRENTDIYGDDGDMKIKKG
jgi:hypothetical protein